MEFIKISNFFIRPNDLIRIETETSLAQKEGRKVSNGDGNITHVFVSDGKRFMVSKQIGFWEKKLKTRPEFIRTHQSHMVNINHVKVIKDQLGPVIEVTSGDHIPIAKSRKSVVLESLGAKVESEL